jgi:hypothetical protein
MRAVQHGIHKAMTVRREQAALHMLLKAMHSIWAGGKHHQRTSGTLYSRTVCSTLHHAVHCMDVLSVVYACTSIPDHQHHALPAGGRRGTAAVCRYRHAPAAAAGGSRPAASPPAAAAAPASRPPAVLHRHHSCGPRLRLTRSTHSYSGLQQQQQQQPRHHQQQQQQGGGPPSAGCGGPVGQRAAVLV